MGLSSSQARLLTLTGRMHDIEYKAQRLEAQKLQMANESRRVYEDYLDALDRTKIQHKTLTTDGSITYKDVTYNDLCLYGLNEQYGLFSTKSGFMYVPEEVKNIYESSGSASAFATAMSGYIPPSAPSFPTEGHGSYVPPTSNQISVGSDISLSGGQNAYTTIQQGNAIQLTLNNPVDGKTLTYSVDSLSEESNVSFDYLNNGRIVITGNGLKITAGSGQSDDIILLGSNNEIYTEDGKDIVRVGYCLDSNGKYALTSNNNKIDSGAGNDNVTIFSIGNTLSNTETAYYTSSTAKNSTNVSSSPNIKTSIAYSDGFANQGINNQTISNIEGFAAQGSAGDCRILTLINSIGGNNNNGDLSNYVNITDNGTSYTVEFKKYDTTSGGSKSVSVNKSDIEHYNGVTGDVTTVVIDYALNKLMYQNRAFDGDTDLQNSSTNSQNAISRAQYRTISKYFFGNSNFAMYESIDNFVNLWNDYNNKTNNVTNLSVGFKTTNESLGIYSAHAYSVKNVVMDGNNIKYVELVNPWNDADVLRLNGNTFEQYFEDCYTFGSNYNPNNIIYRNINAIMNADVVSEAGTSTGERGEYQYYYNMYNAIKEAGGCEIIPNDMCTNTKYLTNIINGGFAYIKTVDSKNEWIDTSIATNTSLQEITDEIELKKAEAKYESDMKRIDLKDRKYDTDLAALDAERNAIKQEMETLKTVAKDNIERTFRLFS